MLLLSLVKEGVIQPIVQCFERRPEIGYPIGAVGVAFGAITKWWPSFQEWINDYMVIGGAALLTLTIIAQGRNAFRRDKGGNDKR